MTLPTDTTVLDGPAILAAARAVAPVLREEAEAGERGRRLTPRAVEALRSTGVFRMAMPRAWGGPEVDIRTQTEIIEELSAADGAAGWCAMIGSDGGFYTAPLEDSVARGLYPDLDMITAGWIVPAGRLHRVAGGYRLEGRWQFGSGCTHADVIIGGALVFEDGAPVMTEDGRPETRVAMLPAGEFEILDTWHTTGLAGSGSHDYAVEGAFVPAGQTFRFGDLRRRRRAGTLYAWPGMFFANLPGVPLGIARAALRSAEQILADKMLVPEMRPAREDPRVRAGVAQVHAMVGAARSYQYDVLGELWSTLETGAEPSLRLRAALVGAHMHTIRTCRDAVRLLADVVGSASIYRRCPLERHQRDLTTIGQHLMGQPKIMEMAGALWLGVDKALARHPLSAEGLI
ncbi:acyl-CoA dehydrogenase family protein [Actinoallomurus soli]|uniref:acyl-CoA dehydrogenase family protein n=1 Tax=Actinoallomurus soli TaxID=2952535 RepID=UPI0020937037|nr:acyl-CoA dehydrogenase family protein [Actinoallomurus soli]MCO5972378.1 acyl-CoA dehydrogenase family protein [Actinoallomurus soli]